MTVVAPAEGICPARLLLSRVLSLLKVFFPSYDVAVELSKVRSDNPSNSNLGELIVVVRRALININILFVVSIIRGVNDSSLGLFSLDVPSVVPGLVASLG